MEASRKFDAIPSDRLFGEEAYVRSIERHAIEREHEASGRYTQGEDYARVLHLLALARSPLYAQDCGWLHGWLYNAVLQLVQNLDPTLSPLDSYVVDADTTREMVKLYGTVARWQDDMREAKRLDGDVDAPIPPNAPIIRKKDKLFPWEAKDR